MNTSYALALTERLAFPTESVEVIADAAEKIEKTALLMAENVIKELRESDYLFGGFLERLSPISKAAGVHNYTAALVCLLCETEYLEKRYGEQNIPTSVFLETFVDLRCKMYECKDIKGIWGIYDVNWFQGFFRMTRFGLGRFQYELSTFAHELYGAQGNYVRKGDTVVFIHIPSGGIPLTDEVRFDSYRRAKAFFFPKQDTPVPFVCSSWLLWPDYEPHLPKSLNLVKFRHDFALLSCSADRGFSNAWRVFGAAAELSPTEYPRDTTQRRIFADYCINGGAHGGGYGVFFFDGNKIIR